jgi:predicted thioredoxin/glutaredoxin
MHEVPEARREHPGGRPPSGVDATVEEVHDLTALVMQGILTTPALMIDGKVTIAGHVAAVPQIEELLTGRA